MHRRRQRMLDRIADQAVDGGLGSQGPYVELVAHSRQRQLPRRHAVARVGPGCAEPSGENARGGAAWAHADHHHGSAAGARQRGQSGDVGQAPRQGGEFHDLRTRRTHQPQPLGRVRGHAVEVVVRPYDTPAVAALHERVTGIRLDVDILSAQVPRLLEERHSRLLVAVESATLPRRTARGDDAGRAAGERAGHVEILDAVEAQFHQVGPLDFVPAASQLGHRIGRHGGAEQCCWHERKTPLQPVVEEACGRTSRDG